MTVAPADTVTFLLTPLREGRRLPCGQTRRPAYFYSRPCGRGDTPSLTSPSTVILFLLTPLREGRRKRPTQNPYPSRFLLTPLREGRRRNHGNFCARPHFYSRPCGRGDISRTSGRGRWYEHFYSRPCGRGDERRPAFSAVRPSISTHAPAGGATGMPAAALRRFQISTHAPAGGATPGGQSSGRAVEISTHAPAGGAT